MSVLIGVLVLGGLLGFLLGMGWSYFDGWRSGYDAGFEDGKWYSEDVVEVIKPGKL